MHTLLALVLRAHAWALRSSARPAALKPAAAKARRPENSRRR